MDVRCKSRLNGPVITSTEQLCCPSQVQNQRVSQMICRVIDFVGNGGHINLFYETIHGLKMGYPSLAVLSKSSQVSDIVRIGNDLLRTWCAVLSEGTSITLLTACAVSMFLKLI